MCKSFKGTLASVSTFPTIKKCGYDIHPSTGYKMCIFLSTEVPHNKKGLKLQNYLKEKFVKKVRTQNQTVNGFFVKVS